MEFIRFLHIQMASWRRNEAKTLRWDPCDRVLGRLYKEILERVFKMKKLRAAWVPDLTVNRSRRVEENDTAASVGISRFISNISGFISSYTAMELK